MDAMDSGVGEPMEKRVVEEGSGFSSSEMSPWPQLKRKRMTDPGVIPAKCQDMHRRSVWNAVVLVAAVACSGVSGCAVTGEPVMCKFGGAEHRFDAKVNGMNLTAMVLLDGQVIISHSWPPFANSRDEQVVQVGDHEVRSVLRIIKGLGNTTAQVYVYVDGEQVGAFYF